MKQEIEIIDYAAALAVNKQESNPLPDVSNLPAHEAEDVINSLMLKRVIRALNTDQNTGVVWEPNWNNDSERKYTIWPEIDADNERPGGFGFSGACYDNCDAGTHAGSRLCLQSREKVKQLYKHFTPLLIKCYLIIK